jgi:beta-lactamase superfamily II metal-dependent hydrolase
MKRKITSIITILTLTAFVFTSLVACGKSSNAVEIESSQEGTESQVTTGENSASTSSEPAPSSQSGTTSTTTATTTSGTTLTITCIKGGAADAFVLISDNHVTVIDTGLDKKADILVDFLNEQGVTRVDELIITHFDKDHVGGADHVLNNFEVGTVYTTYHSKESDDITNYMEALSAAGLVETTVSEVISYEADGVSFTIYPPQTQSYSRKESNNSSLVIRASIGENSMLFAGDAEYERISELLQTEGLKSTILKVPHHGRYNDNTKAFIDYVDPEYAIITSSTSEPEDQQVLDILAAAGVTTYLTRDGNVTIIMTSTAVEIDQ